MNKTFLLRQVGKPLLNQWSFKTCRKMLLFLPSCGMKCCTVYNFCNKGYSEIVRVDFKIVSLRAFEKRHINSGTVIVGSTEKIGDSMDRIDRHVSLGQESDRSDSAMNPSNHETNENNPSRFCPRKVLLLSKLSRYQFERQQHPKNMSETEFRRILEKRGSDYTLIKYYHNVHKSVVEKIVQALETKGMEVKICQRMDYSEGLIEWADLIVTAGGDGTFLLGASMIKDRNQPIMGINTDPTRSEGHLCIEKHWSLNVDDAIQALVDGKVNLFS